MWCVFAVILLVLFEHFSKEHFSAILALDLVPLASLLQVLVDENLGEGFFAVSALFQDQVAFLELDALSV